MANQSFFEKVNTLINASLHGMVDRALQQNSVAVMDEYIRQAEKNLEALEESAATVGGTTKTLKRKYEEFAASADKLDRDIDALILQGKDSLAAAAQTELNAKQQLAQEYYQQWQTQENQYQQMQNMQMKLEARLKSIKQQREQVRALIELAAAKRQQAQTIRSLNDLANIGDDRISSFAEQVRTQLDQEDARLEMASRNLSAEIEEVVGGAEVERQLEERRRRLNASSGGAGGAASAGSASESSSSGGR